MNAYTDTLIFLLIGFILLLWVLPEEKTTHLSKAQPHRDEDNTDYDFMSTHESIPAQFDLAIALAHMGKKQESIELLRKLSSHPHLATRERAERMIETISARSHVVTQDD